MHCLACREDQFFCRKLGYCIPATWICDNQNDCLDFSDEQNCSTSQPYLLYCSSISGIVDDCWWLLPSEFCKIHLNVGNGQSREPNVSAHFRYLPGLVSESKLTRCCFSCVIFTVYSARWLGRENSPPWKKLTIPPPNGRQIVCSSFFGRDNELPLYHVETFF